MPDDRDKTTNGEAPSPTTDSTLAVAGLLFVGPLASGTGGVGTVAEKGGRSGVWVGPAAGWIAPRGIHLWERELSFVTRASLTSALVASLRATLPVEQIAPKRFPLAARAAAASPLIGIASNLVQPCVEQGLRVHTVGIDRVSGDIYYFEEGGGREPVRVQGGLVEMLAPSLKPGTSNDEISVMMDGLLDRMLLALSEGEVSELDVELADALPRLTRDGKGLEGTDLEAFEVEAAALAARAARFEAAARQIPDLLSTASRRGQGTTTIPVFGEAVKQTKPALDLSLRGKPLQLSPQPIWTVTGAPRIDEVAKPAAKAVDAAKPAAAAPAPQPKPAVEAKPAPKPVESKPEVRAPAKSQPEMRAVARSQPEMRGPAKSQPEMRPLAQSEPGLDPKKPAASPRPAAVAASPRPAAVAASPRPAAVAAKAKDPSPAPGPVRPRVSSSVDTMPPPAPVLNHLSDRPPASPRQGTKPLPLQTPVPPPPAAVAPLMTAAPGSNPAPAAPPDVPSEPAAERKPTAAKAAKEEKAIEKAPPLPIVPNVASSAIKPKRSSTTWVVVAFAILALAYVALKSFH
jgi:hypothetical protein